MVKYFIKQFLPISVGLYVLSNVVVMLMILYTDGSIQWDMYINAHPQNLIIIGVCSSIIVTLKIIKKYFTRA